MRARTQVPSEDIVALLVEPLCGERFCSLREPTKREFLLRHSFNAAGDVDMFGAQRLNLPVA